MTPIRWLVALPSLAGMYAVFLLSTSDPGEPGHGRDWLVPQQINSVILTTLTGAVIIAAFAQLVAPIKADLLLLRRQLDEAKGHVCWMEATAQSALDADAAAVALGADVLPSPGTVAAMRRLAGKVTRA